MNRSQRATEDHLNEKAIKSGLFVIWLITCFSLPASAQVGHMRSDSAFAVYMDSVNAELKRSQYNDALQSKYAEAFYSYYRSHPDSPVASEALKDAVIMWINLSQGEKLEQVLMDISADSEVWSELLNTLYFSSAVRIQTDPKFLPVLEKLNGAQTDPEALSVIKFALAGHYDRAGRFREAMGLYREVLALGLEGFFSNNAGIRVEQFEAIGPGKKVPELRLIDREGKERKLSDFRGKVVILDFWTDESVYPMRTHRSLESLAGKFSEDELQILGVIQSRDEKRVARLMLEFDVDWPLLRIPEEHYEETEKSFKLNGFFRRLIIDADGKITSNRPESPEEILQYLKNEAGNSEN